MVVIYADYLITFCKYLNVVAMNITKKPKSKISVFRQKEFKSMNHLHPEQQEKKKLNI